jgi:hypothetical protein
VINSALELSSCVSYFESETSRGRQQGSSYGRSEMRNALWILVIAGLGVSCGWVVIGPWVPRNQGVIFLLIALFAAPNIGAIWMMYTAIRNEFRPLPFVALAYVPFSFLWYYAERYRIRLKCFSVGFVASTRSSHQHCIAELLVSSDLSGLMPGVIIS